jgi:two-component system, OmpR family, KDP operon response regulator KdpE
VSSSGPRVLVVDDERPIRHFLRVSLTAHGYFVYEAACGREALHEASGLRPDIVVLDLGLPDMDGVDVIRELREWSQVPIVVLSVREGEADKIAALDAGADDYVTKPFGVGELVARLRVAVRRSAQTGPELVFEVDELRVDFGRRLVTLRGDEVALTPTEYDLLRVMVQQAGRVLTHRYLLRQVWGASYEGETHLLRVNISNLRRKLEPDPTRPYYVRTEPGVGYRLRAEA